MAKQYLLSRLAFERWVIDNRVQVSPTAELIPCVCRDRNCHGWRFVEPIGQRPDPMRIVITEPELVPVEHTY